VCAAPEHAIAFADVQDKPPQDEDRAACEARMMGHGTTSGSAAAGGILRELEVTTPAATPAPRAQPAEPAR